MQKEDVILFGASKLGEIAYIMLKDKYNILYYCDNDKNKIGGVINGIKIIDIEELKEISNGIKIIISSSYYKEISKQLIMIEKNNFEVFLLNINSHIENSQKYKFDIKEINLGKFLETVNWELNIKNLTFIIGSSKVLDYIFLKAIAIKFKISNYLEIGSFIGESIDALSDVVDKCYSITLPDSVMENSFARMGMRNFSSYFMNKNKNVIQYKYDSKAFNFNVIDEKIDLVFIDGDHSYRGVYIDTKNIFNFIDTDSTIVVWHDFKISKDYRLPVIDAVFDAIPKEFHNNIYCVDNNLCGVYIPDKYLKDFEFSKDENILHSYEITLKIKENRYE